MGTRHAAIPGTINNPAYAVSKTIYEGRHLAPIQDITLISAVNAAVTPVAASSAANVELYATGKSCRRALDLTDADEIRLTGLVIANGNAAAAAWKVSYMTTAASTWAGTDSGATFLLGAGTAGALRTGAWTTIPAGMKADIFLTVLVAVAHGTTPPTVGSLSLQYR